MDAEVLGDVDGGQPGPAPQVGQGGGVLGDVEELEGVEVEGFGEEDEGGGGGEAALLPVDELAA